MNNFEKLQNKLEEMLNSPEETLDGCGAMNTETGEMLFITNYKIDGETKETIRHKLSVNENSYDFTLVLEDKPEITITINDIVEATVEISELVCTHYNVNKEFIKDTIRNQWLEPMEAIALLEGV